MRRRDFIKVIAGSGAAWPFGTRAQQGERIRRVGVLMSVAENDPEGRSRVTAFQQQLQEIGWTDRRNVRLELRWFSGRFDLAKVYAGELVALMPDVLVATNAAALEALHQATRAAPIVFLQVVNPVGGGFVSSLAQPGGNITGFTNFEFSMLGKWLQILKEIAPYVTRVAVIYNPDNPTWRGDFATTAINSAAPSFAVALSATAVRDAEEIETAINQFAREPNGGLVALPDITALVHRDLIVALAVRHRLPAIYPFRSVVVSGGLMSYGNDVAEAYRQAASYVDRILRGENPADLPVQAPTKFELVINVKTAKALGLAIPQTLLATADEVIE